MAREHECERERERPCASCHPFSHVVETQRGYKKGKVVFSIRTSPSAHSHVTPACASTVSDIKNKPGRLLLFLGYESQN